MKQLFLSTLSVIFLWTSCTHTERNMMDALPSITIQTLNDVVWDGENHPLEGVSDFLEEQDIHLNADERIWAEMEDGGFITLERITSEQFDSLLAHSTAKELEFQQWSLYELQDSAKGKVFFTYQNGVFISSTKGFYIEESILAFHNKTAGETDALPELLGMGHQEQYLDLSHFNWGLSTGFFEKLNIRNIKESRVIGEIQDADDFYFNGRIFPEKRYNTNKDTTWESMLKMIPDQINYAGFHSYETQDILMQSVIGQFLPQQPSYTYATFLMQNEVAEDYLFWIVDVQSDAGEVLKQIESEFGIVREVEHPIFPIKRIPVKDLCGERDFIPYVPRLQQPYVTHVNNYLIFTSHSNALELYFEQYIINNHIGNNVEFINLLNRRKERELNGSLHYVVTENEQGNILRHGWLDIQDNTKLDVLLESYEIKEETTQSAWIYHADTILNRNVFKLPFKKSEALIFQDASHRLFMVDMKGELLEYTQLNESIISEIFHFKDIKSQHDRYLFNTQNLIYILDGALEPIHHFPIELTSPASVGIGLVDIPNRQSRFAFLACENGNVYGYDVNKGMKPMPSWNPLIDVGALDFPVTILQGENDLQITYLNKDREFIALDRKAQEIFEPIFIDTLFQNEFFVDANVIGKERYVFNQKNGRLKIINPLGKVFHLQAFDSLVSKEFLLLDVMGAEQKEYVFLKEDRIEIYGYKENDFLLIHSIQLNDRMTNIFPVEINGQFYLGGNDDKHQIYLWNEKGELWNDFPLRGDGPFLLHALGKRFLLVTPYSDKIISYTIPNHS